MGRAFRAAILILGLSLSQNSTAAPQDHTFITADDLVRLQDIEALSLSPDGSRAAFYLRRADPVRNLYETGWYVIATDGNDEARRIADGGEPIRYIYQGRINGAIIQPTPIWSPDGRWLFYLREDKGRVQIWRSSADGARTEQLTRSEGDVRSLALSRDGARLLFTTEPSQTQIEAGLAREGRAGFLFDRRFFPSYSTRPTLPRSVDFFERSNASNVSGGASGSQIWVYELQHAVERKAAEADAAELTAINRGPVPANRPNFRENAARSPSGALAWTEARDPKLQGYRAPLTLVVQPAGAQSPVVCGAPVCTTRLFKGVWWRSENEVVFAIGVSDGELLLDTEVYSWRPGRGAPRRILRTPNKLMSSFEWDCAIARDRLVCLYEEPAYPRRLVAVDLNTAAIKTLFDPNPDFARFNLGSPPQRIKVRTASGAVTYGQLVLPPDHRPGKRLPLVIATYRCGGFLRGGTGDEYPIFPLAAHGMAVFCHNVADGDTDYDRTARMSAIEYEKWARGPGDLVKHRIQEGLDATVSHLGAKGIIDPNRVGVTGLSLGSETVHFAVFNMDRLAAAIASGPGAEPSGTFLYGEAAQELLESWGLGTANDPRWRGLALSLNADKARAPLLLNVGEHEMLNAVETVAALRAAKASVEMFVFPDESHMKIQPAHRRAIYERNIDWMNFWLRDKEDGDPAKVEQYKRWGAMRATRLTRVSEAVRGATQTQ